MSNNNQPQNKPINNKRKKNNPSAAAAPLAAASVIPPSTVKKANNPYKLPNIKNGDNLYEIKMHKNIINLQYDTGVTVIDIQIAYFNPQKKAILFVPPVPHEAPIRCVNRMMHIAPIHINFQFCLENRINAMRFNFTHKIRQNINSQKIHDNLDSYILQTSNLYDYFQDFLQNKQINKSTPVDIILVGLSMGTIISLQLLLRRPYSTAAFIMSIPVRSIKNKVDLYFNSGKLLGIAYGKKNNSTLNSEMKNLGKTLCKYLQLEMYLLDCDFKMTNYEELLKSFRNFLIKTDKLIEKNSKKLNTPEY